METQPAQPQSAPPMLSEHDATRLWQRLFRGQPITALSIQEAETVLGNMPPESPLKLRLSQELDEIRNLQESEQAREARESAPRGGSRKS